MPEYGVWRQEKRHKQSEAERDTELYLYLNSFQAQPFHGMQFVTLRTGDETEDHRPECHPPHLNIPDVGQQ